MYCSWHLLVHFYGIDLSDTLSLCSRRRFSALTMLVAVRWKKGLHSLTQFVEALCKHSRSLIQTLVVDVFLIKRVVHAMILCVSVISCFLKFCPHVQCVAYQFRPFCEFFLPFSVSTCVLFVISPCVYVLCVLRGVSVSPV